MQKIRYASSDRKADLYSPWETLWMLARAVMTGGRSLRRRETTHLWYDRRRYSSDGFVVSEGSYCRLKVVDSAKTGFLSSARQRLIADGIIVEEGGHYVFKEDYLFKAPSGAAMVVLGRTANGWLEWKNKEAFRSISFGKRQRVKVLHATNEG